MNRVLQQYLHDAGTGQLLIVRHIAGSDAILELYLRTEDGSWKKDAEGKAYVGREGLGKTSEGDWKTPEGDFPLTRAFGALPNPGTAFDYTDLTPTIYGCDDDCEYYNQIIDVSKVPHECHGEKMAEKLPAYNYGCETGFNPGNVYPLGSLIFLHCWSGRPYTAGCVAVEQQLMEHILQTCAPGAVICIHPDRYYDI